MRFISSFNIINTQYSDRLNKINRIISDFEKKSSLESIKPDNEFQRDYHVNKLVMMFISSCLKILDSLLVM